MSKNQWIVFGLAVAIIVLLALLVLGVAGQLGRRPKVEADRDRATTLRQEGDRARLQADKRAAKAANADAKAPRTRVEAEKPAQEATAPRKEAAESRGPVLDHHRRAIEFDPDHDAEPNGQRPEQTFRSTTSAAKHPLALSRLGQQRPGKEAAGCHHRRSDQRQLA